MDKEVFLTDIVHIENWQRLQDHFGQVIGVTIRTVDKSGKLITRPSNPSRICEEIMTNSPVGAARCKQNHPTSLADLTADEKWKEGYQCYLGLQNFCIPVIAYNNYAVAYILIGPVFLGRRREKQGYKQVAEELGVDLDKFIDWIIELKRFSFTGIQSAIELISGITCCVAQLGYNRFKLERIVPIPKIGKMVHKFYIDKILSALLDVAFNTTSAEFGSIMLLDEDTGELYIKMAKGLSKDIIKNTRLKIGEGIAGLAVEEKRFLLLDDTLTDKRVKARLRRPEIKSAFVAPFKVKDEPLGVMNIGTSNHSSRITPEKVATLNRLIELTETTFSDLARL